MREKPTNKSGFQAFAVLWKSNIIFFWVVPMKMETTHVSETSTLYNYTPGNYPKEDNIQFWNQITVRYLESLHEEKDRMQQ
jgi:hypothetical protein